MVIKKNRSAPVKCNRQFDLLNLFRLITVANLKSKKRPAFLHVCATCSELPAINVSSMHLTRYNDDDDDYDNL